MKQNFNDCLQRVLKDEGGYNNTPGDHGGPTKYGIILADLPKGSTIDDIKNLTVAQASDIYKQKYWDALSADSLPSGVDYTCFDYGVNSGLGRPRKALQKFKSLKGTELVTAINNERTAFLKALAAKPQQGKFLKGWLSRVDRVQAYSLQLAKKDYTSSTGAATGAVIAGSSFATYFHDHWQIILGGTVAAAVVIGLVIHYIKNKGK